MKSYFAHGKVLLAGEYLVTKGMEALAFPVVPGQWLKVWETPSKGTGKLVWQAKDNKGQEWFKAEINTDQMQLVESSDSDVAKSLLELLQCVKAIKPEFFEEKTIRVETENEFPSSHGLGTSSTLVVLLAQWAQVDAFALQKAVFGGSAYDVSVCQTGKPVVYWLENEEPSWSSFSLNSAWTENWFLVFPGEKKNSRNALEEVKDKMNMVMANPLFRWQLDQILKGLKSPGNKIMLEAGLEMWQGMLATFLGIKRTYDDLGIVPVPGGLCKYLGAWGGDVILTNSIILDLYASKFEGMDRVAWNEFVISK